MRLPSHYNRAALEAEADLLRWLGLQGYAVEKSSPSDDKYRDIDAWVKGYQFNDWVSISVKAMTVGCSTGELGFEYMSQRCPNNQGWYVTGRADYYVILRDPSLMTPHQQERYPVRDGYTPKLIWLAKTRVKAYLRAGLPSKTKGLSEYTLQQQGGLNSISYYIPAKLIVKKCDVMVLGADWRDIVKQSRG